MFLHRVVLGSTVVVAFASSLLQTLVDDVNSEAIDTTTEPLAQCPLTVLHADFQHDGMQKSRHAQAIFHFNPPHDGCYIVEEMHPMLMCEGSKNTKVHVEYCKGLQANGTVDQAANGGQWAFLGALQFYAGHPGKVTLSNEGTEPGTLTVFDQVRFTWSGKDCMEVDAHPRRVEIRIKADFQNVAQRAYKFGRALTTELATLAHVPENSLRLIGLHSGSIIAEFLVLPNVAEDVLIPSHSAQRNVGYLRDAVAKNASELCTLAHGSRRLEHIGGPLENCYVEVKDLGFAKPSVEPFEPVKLPTVPEQHTQSETQHVNLLQTLVDDVDSEAHDTTMEPLAQCPSTVLYADFQHDGMQKNRHAQASFHFDPPHDGCYIVEEMHPMLMCEGSKNTKVHVEYCKGLQANGTVDQAANGGQWAFLGALQFYAGHHGKVTLSNEGTEPGTLTVFDQVRFTWSGKDCLEVDAHPRRVDIRINADFQNVAQRTYDFGRALTTKLAALAHVPENSLRLIGLRSGSIIAEFLVLPNVAEDVLIPNHSAQRNVGYLRDAVAKNAAELCALALGSRRLGHIGGPLKNCYVEVKDLGFAKPILKPIKSPVPEQRTQVTQQTETKENDNLSATSIVIIVVCIAVAVKLLLLALYLVRSHRTKNASQNSNVGGRQPNSMYEVKVASSMEAGEPVKAVDVEEDDKQSTICPSNDDKQSDKQSEQSFCVAACKNAWN